MCSCLPWGGETAIAGSPAASLASSAPSSAVSSPTRWPPMNRSTLLHKSSVTTNTLSGRLLGEPGRIEPQGGFEVGEHPLPLGDGPGEMRAFVGVPGHSLHAEAQLQVEG